MPAPFDCDVIVLGSGFGGSLTALLLSRIGLRPVLIDRGRHPRFAIGESSTPVADLVLSDLCERYDLPRLKPLAKYGTWQRTYPELRCGLKRGFSYFRHEHGKTFEPAPAHANELLVAASSDDQHSDTHWHRADVDAFFASEVRREGLSFFEGVEATVERVSHGWRVTGGSGADRDRRHGEIPDRCDRRSGCAAADAEHRRFGFDPPHTIASDFRSLRGTSSLARDVASRFRRRLPLPLRCGCVASGDRRRLDVAIAL